jgi:hypothetical protein
VQLGEDHLDAREPRLGLDVDRDATGAVPHLDALVRPQDDIDLRPASAERLVDGVVDDLPQAVHEPAGIRRADVHAGALAHGLEALEHRQMPG